MIKNLTYVFKTFMVYALLCIACVLMLRIVDGYGEFRDDVQFLAFKQEYIHNQIWKTAFYIHVFSAIVALFAGFTQFSKSFLNDHRYLHRIFGRIYAWNILMINFPAGMILAIYANGELPGRLAFILLDFLWALFTYKAVMCAYKKDFVNHKNYMIRSYALTLSAITLRSWKMVLSHYFAIDPVELYITIAWLGFVPNLIIAELFIERNRRLRKVHMQKQKLSKQN